MNCPFSLHPLSRRDSAQLRFLAERTIFMFIIARWLKKARGDLPLAFIFSLFYITDLK